MMPQLFVSVYSLPTFTTSARVDKLQKPGFRAQYTGTKIEFNIKWPFTVIQGHLIWKWKATEELYISM